MRLVVDGTEGIEGRALLALSALHLAAGWLCDWEIVVAAAKIEPPVFAAVEALRWDCGLDVVATPGDDAACFDGANHFLAVAFASVEHLPLTLLQQRQIPALVAVQYPDEQRHGAAAFTLQRAAHDPALLAAILRQRVGAP